MFTRILVPLDGSSLAEGAIPHAELFARIFGARISLLQVLELAIDRESTKAVDPLNWQIRKAEADMYLKGIAERIRSNLGENPLAPEEEGASRVNYFIREGKAAENIVDFAHSENIDLLIISTHGSGGLSRWSISSVTQKVINMIYLPVLIVRSYERANTMDVIDNYPRILLPIDCSRRAECSITAAVELARGAMPAGKPGESVPGKSTLVLTAVRRPPEIPIPEPFPEGITAKLEELSEVSRLAVAKYLEEMKERLPVEAETCVVEGPSVITMIQDLVEQQNIDLVVLCAHGYSGKGTWPYGTVSRNYIEHGEKPVLVIQDLPLSQVKQTAAEIAATKAGRR